VSAKAPATQTYLFTYQVSFKLKRRWAAELVPQGSKGGSSIDIIIISSSSSTSTRRWLASCSSSSSSSSSSRLAGTRHRL
jgi:hypothetical protein